MRCQAVEVDQGGHVLNMRKFGGEQGVDKTGRFRRELDDIFQCPSYIIIDQRTEQCLIADDSVLVITFDCQLLRTMRDFAVRKEHVPPRLCLAGDRFLISHVDIPPHKNLVKVYNLFL